MDLNRLLYPLRKRTPSPRDRYASYNDRVFSSIIDAICVFFILGPPLLWIQDQFYTIYELDAALARDPQDWKELRSLLFTVLLSSALQMTAICSALILCEHKFGTTPGRWLLGLRLVDARTEEKPSIFQLVRRCLGYAVSLPPLMLGYIWCNWDSRRQTWHDKIGGTVVLDSRPNGWYWAQIKRLYRKLRGRPEPEVPPPVNDNEPGPNAS